MASGAAARPLASASRAITSAAPRRQFSSQLQQRITPQRPIQRQIAARQTFRRSYADQAPVAKAKRKGAGFFRWTWRLTYLSAIGGLAYVAYGIYQERNPRIQEEPDPSKKTLVVLGELLCCGNGCVLRR